MHQTRLKAQKQPIQNLQVPEPQQTESPPPVTRPELMVPEPTQEFHSCTFDDITMTS